MNESDDHQSLTPISPNRWTQKDTLVLIAAVAALTVFRMHAFAAPLETDECNYAYIGERLAEGDRLYTDVWDHQPPGVFAFTWLVGSLLGFSPFVWRGCATLAASATLVLLFLICRQHFGRSAGWFAAALFALASSDPGVAGEGCNREIYMNALGVAALYLTLRGRWWGVLAAGACLGLSSLFKTVAATQWLFLVPALLLFPRPFQGGAAIRRLLLFCAGPVAIWGTTYLYFAATSRADAFVDATFVYNLGYGEVDVPIWEKFAAFFGSWPVFASLLGLWIAGAAGHGALPWRQATGPSIAIAGFAVGSFLAVCLPGKFWPHYYMLLLPSLVLGTAAIFDRLSQPVPRIAYAVVLTGWVLLSQVASYLNVPPDRIAAHRYGDRMSWALEHGLRIGQVTEPDDYVYVCGIDTGMYYYSHRKCPTRYTLTTMLLGDDQAAKDRRKTFLGELQANPPRLILIVRGLPYIEELDHFIRDRAYIKIAEDPGRMDILCDPNRPIETIPWQSQPATSQ